MLMVFARAQMSIKQESIPTTITISTITPPSKSYIHVGIYGLRWNQSKGHNQHDTTKSGMEFLKTMMI